MTTRLQRAASVIVISLLASSGSVLAVMYQTGKLQGQTANSNFGAATAVDVDWLVTGATADTGAAASTGAAYVFHGVSGAWSQQQKLAAPDGAVYDEFGSSVAISGNFLVVGAQKD